MLYITHWEKNRLIACHLNCLILSYVQFGQPTVMNRKPAIFGLPLHMKPARVSHMEKTKLYSKCNALRGAIEANHVSLVAIPLACHPI